MRIINKKLITTHLFGTASSGFCLHATYSVIVSMLPDLLTL